MKFLIVILVIIFLAIFHKAIEIVFLPGVDGVKYLSLFVSGSGLVSSASGTTYYVLHKPIFMVKNKDEIDWSYCNSLNKYHRYYYDFNKKGSYKFLVEDGGDYYRAYISSGREIVYVIGAEDLSGDPPSNKEKEICGDIQSTG